MQIYAGIYIFFKTIHNVTVRILNDNLQHWNKLIITALQVWMCYWHYVLHKLNTQRISPGSWRWTSRADPSSTPGLTEPNPQHLHSVCLSLHCGILYHILYTQLWTLNIMIPGKVVSCTKAKYIPIKHVVLVYTMLWCTAWSYKVQYFCPDGGICTSHLCPDGGICTSHLSPDEWIWLLI